MAGALQSPVAHEPGHTIYYLAGEDSAADRHNIALLARIARRSTTPLGVEIFYHRPLKLSNWTLKTGSLRYVRLRSASEFVLAERIAGVRTEAIIFLSHRIFAHSEDIWRLLGYAAREPFAMLQPCGVLPDRGDKAWTFALQSARFDLARYTGSPDQPAIIALNLRLLGQHSGRRSTSFLLRKFYADLISGKGSRAPLMLTGRSRALAPTAATWLPTLRNTISAYRTWRTARQFPWWFSYRHPLFIVAQLGAYASLLILPVSIRGSFILLLFVVGTTLPYFLSGLQLCARTAFRNWRRTPALLRRMGARLVLYLIG